MRLNLRLLSLYFAFGMFASGLALAQSNVVATDEIIVKTRFSTKSSPNYNFLGKAHAQKGLQLKQAWHGMGLYNFKVQSGKSVEQTIEELKNDPDVEYVEPNLIFTKASVGQIKVLSQAENDALAGALEATGAAIQESNAWSIINPSAVPVVAVIDTGVEITHTVFANSSSIWRNPGEIAGNGIDDDQNGYVDDVHGWNFVDNSAHMYDDDGHGTHVAGTVLAVTQDIFSPPLVAASIRIMPLKFLNGSGSGKTSDAIEAIYYAVENGATVLNNSWGGPTYSAALHEAITYAYNQGVIFVAAAGNNGSNNDSQPMYPASYDVPNVIAVASTTDADNLSSFSNYGLGTVLLGSPGSGIYSTYKGNSYAYMSGTSMAAPFVAGTAALMKGEAPNLLGYQAKQLLASTADFKVSLNNKVSSQGRLNVLNSVAETQSASINSTQPNYTFINQDRGLASGMTASGCGTVTKMYQDMNRGGGSGGAGAEPWHVFLVVLLLSLPVGVYNYLRHKKPESRRKHDRYRIATEVKVQVGDKELVGAVSSISMGGLQINTDQLLEQGGIVQMSIRSPDGKEVVQVEGKVVWSESNRAYGVQFQEAKAPVLSTIQSWTKSLNKA